MKKKKSQKISEFIAEARVRFDECVSAESSNRELSIRSQHYENGEQWDDDEKNARVGRPCLTINKLSGAVKQIVGDARQNRPRIKVLPVDSVSDPMVANLLTGLIRNIENVSDAESAYDNALECAVRGGIGYWRILTQYSDDDAFDQDIVIERIVNPHSVYLDQSSIDQVYSDIDYAFVVEEMPKDKFDDKYPKSGSTDWDKGDGESKSGWFSSETVRIAEYWYKEPYIKHVFELEDGSVIHVKKPEIVDIPDQMTGEIAKHVIETDGGEQTQPVRFLRDRKVSCKKVKYCKITGNEILEGPNDWPGKYIPIIPCLGDEVWIEGERILRSAITHAIEAQKLYNWARSNNMETMALAPKQPWVLTAEQIKGYEQLWDTAYSVPRPYLPYNHINGQAPPQRLSGSVGDSGANQEAMLAADDIKSTTGIYDASLGARGNETSGIAINSRKRQGDTATFIFPDNQAKSLKYGGKVLVDLIPYVYDGERIVRLMGEELQKQFTPQNTPTAEGAPVVGVDNSGTQAWARINYKDPHTGKIFNDLSLGKYDVVVDAGPGYATKRQEATEGMLAMAQASPAIMPVILPRIAKNQDWDGAQEIGDEVKAMFQPQQPPPDPRIQMAIQKSQQDLQRGEMAIQKSQQDLQKGEIDLQKTGHELEGKKIDLMLKAQDIQSDNSDNDQRMVQIAQMVVMNVLRQIGVR